jgi:hypothetical protein
MLSATSAGVSVAARAVTAGPNSARTTGSRAMGSMGSNSVSRCVGASASHGAVWRVSRGGSSVTGRTTRVCTTVASSASRPRGGASKRRSRRDRPPTLRAAGDENTESPAGGENDAPSETPAAFKTGLSADPAFAEALRAVSDMTDDSTSKSTQQAVTKDDFVAPSIDWGDTKVRNLDPPVVARTEAIGTTSAVPDAVPKTKQAQEVVTYSAADFAANEFTPSSSAETGTRGTFAEQAMQKSASQGFVPAPKDAAPAPVMAPLNLATTPPSNLAVTKPKPTGLATYAPPPEKQAEQVRSFLYPGESELPDDVNMTVWEHLEELRDRALISAGACTAAILLCFCFAKDLVIFLEAPVAEEGVRFLQLGPGEYFFTTVKVAGYCGLLLGAPVVLYEGIAYVLPGLTKDERKFLGPIVLGSSVLFYAGT